MFNAKELRFINKHELCRLATCYKGKPHVVPVCYIFKDGCFYIASDYDTRKFRNVKSNRNVCLVIDEYKPNKAIMVDGIAEILEHGDEFRSIYSIFYDRFDWVRADPWDEYEAPFIKIKPIRKVSWGL